MFLLRLILRLRKNLYLFFLVTDKVFSLPQSQRLVFYFLVSTSNTVCWDNHNTTIPVIDTSRKAFWDAMFSQKEKGEQFCFSKWKTNGAGWKIVHGWKGITTFVVPCQPQGHIPEIGIPHSGTSILFQRHHILVLSVLPQAWNVAS